MLHADPHSPPASQQQLGEFLRQLRRLVLDEADSVRQQLFQIWSRPVATRVAECHAIEGVRVVHVEPSGVITLACGRDASRFREGDVLLLNRGDPAARLERCYRTTREILDFASRMYQLRLPADDEALVPGYTQHMPGGTPPQILTLQSEQDELAQVVNEIRALHARGTPLEHILVLHAEWQGVDRMLERLRKEFGTVAVANPKTARPGRHLRVCTLNAATGLESPIVFVMGTHRMLEQEQSVRLAEDERAELIRDNTRKLYMACTRAGQRLAITYVGDVPELFRQLDTSTRGSLSI